MKRTSFFRGQKLYLSLSLASIILGIFLFITQSSDSDFESIKNDSLSLTAEYFPPLLATIFAVLVGPIIEEFLFRVWVTENKWSRVISALSLVVMGILFSDYYVITIFGLILLLSLKFFKSKLEIIFYLLTSVSFSLFHLSTSVNFVLSIGEFLYFFGIGGFLSYIGLRFGFWKGVFAHMVINFTLVIAALLLNGKSEIKIKDDDGTNYELKFLSVYDFGFTKNNIHESDTFFHKGSLGEISKSLIGVWSPFIIDDQTHSFFNYSFSISNTHGIPKDKALNFIVNQTDLKIDTFEIDAYCLIFDVDFADDKLVDNSPKKLNEISIEGLASLIRVNQKIPVVECNQLEFKNRKIFYDNNFYFIRTIEELQSYLFDVGVIMEKERNGKLNKIVIRD